MAILMTSLKVVCASILALAGSGATYQYVATKLDERNFPPIGKMIDVGGYKLHMIDAGVAFEGQPTIVIDAGAGQNSLDWCLVAPEIAKFARVITYDRAGYAWSDASPLSRTAENVMDELHTMLHNADVSGPYILVGHSLGGINVRFFASKYPDEVAGMILVDAGHEDTFETMPMASSLRPNKMMTSIFMGAQYLGLNRLLSSIFQKTIAESIKKYPLDVQKIYWSQKSATKMYHAFMGECLLVEENFKHLKQDGGFLGDKPLTVIRSDKKLMYEDAIKLGYTEEQVDNQNQWNIDSQADLAKKSSRGKLIVAENSGHLINQDRPDVIIEAVREMVENLRK